MYVCIYLFYVSNRRFILTPVFYFYLLLRTIHYMLAFSCLRDWIGLSVAPANHHHNDCFRGPLCHPQSPPRLLLRLTAAATAPRHHHHFRRLGFHFSIYFGTFKFFFLLILNLWNRFVPFFMIQIDAAFSLNLIFLIYSWFYLLNVCVLVAVACGGG